MFELTGFSILYDIDEYFSIDSPICLSLSSAGVVNIIRILLAIFDIFCLPKVVTIQRTL